MQNSYAVVLIGLQKVFWVMTVLRKIFANQNSDRIKFEKVFYYGWSHCEKTFLNPCNNKQCYIIACQTIVFNTIRAQGFLLLIIMTQTST